MSEGPAPAPASTSHSDPSHKVMIRNIITGVITTVTGASIIWFLGFHNRGDDNKFLQVKEATTEAWKKFVSIHNLYYRNILSINNDKKLMSDLNLNRNEVFKEADRFKADADLILKEKNLDKTFISMLTRFEDREKESKAHVNAYFDNLISIHDSNQPDSIKLSRFVKEINDFIAYSKGQLERTANDMESLCKVLTDTYGSAFNLNDFEFYVIYKKGLINTDSVSLINNGQNKGANNNRNGANADTINTQSLDDSILPGKWNTTGAIIEYTKDGKFKWDVLTTGDKTSGTWKIINNQLYMFPLPGKKIAKNMTWIFDISNLTASGFTMKLNVQPFNIYNLVKIK